MHCGLRGGGEQACRGLGQDDSLFILKLKGSLQAERSASYMGLGVGYECQWFEGRGPQGGLGLMMQVSYLGGSQFWLLL